ncbi:hypothetical protein BDA96_03G108400 [Sorghum bicolor]|uniref:VAN3-binding protein-like auxin canalisation domain-containing protein n=1 Tax=Sorghum bicolor TaxID=4558 RepID=A0A921UMW8_SORBI|nr:hypothetical protein BDA96_03G108400 [Sorghum bicolor]
MWLLMPSMAVVLPVLEVVDVADVLGDDAHTEVAKKTHARSSSSSPTPSTREFFVRAVSLACAAGVKELLRPPRRSAARPSRCRGPPRLCPSAASPARRRRPFPSAELTGHELGSASPASSAPASAQISPAAPLRTKTSASTTPTRAQTS